MNEEYQTIDLIGIDQILRTRYPDQLPEYSEERSPEGLLLSTLRISRNATHELSVKIERGQKIYYRERFIGDHAHE